MKKSNLLNVRFKNFLSLIPAFYKLLFKDKTALFLIKITNYNINSLTNTKKACRSKYFAPRLHPAKEHAVGPGKSKQLLLKTLMSLIGQVFATVFTALDSFG